MKAEPVGWRFDGIDAEACDDAEKTRNKKNQSRKHEMKKARNKADKLFVFS